MTLGEFRFLSGPLFPSWVSPLAGLSDAKVGSGEGWSPSPRVHGPTPRQASVSWAEQWDRGFTSSARSANGTYLESPRFESRPLSNKSCDYSGFPRTPDWVSFLPCVDTWAEP